MSRRTVTRREPRQQRYKRDLTAMISEVYERACDADLDMTSWAKAAGIHRNTIQRLAEGTTRFPQWQTVMAMARAVGMTMETRPQQLRVARRTG